MPNHVTTIIEARELVIKSMLNSKGDVDFSCIIPIPIAQEKLIGDFYTKAEYDAKKICQNYPTKREAEKFIRDLISSRIYDPKNEITQQTIDMIRNKYLYGFFHVMDFACKKWGTKWNAYRCSVSSTLAQFCTAWSHPEPVIEALSMKFPEEVITVRYADEDLGNNCGEYSIQNGEIVSSNIFIGRSTQESRKFAFNILYPNNSPEEFGLSRDFDYIEE